MTEASINNILTAEISTVKDSLNGKNVTLVVHMKDSREITVKQVNGSFFKTPSCSDGVLFLAKEENTTDGTIISDNGTTITKGFAQKRYYINVEEISTISVNYDKLVTYDVNE